MWKSNLQAFPRWFLRVTNASIVEEWLRAKCWRYPPTWEGVRNQIDRALSAQFMKRLITYELRPGKIPDLTFHTDTQAYGELMRTQLGKTILFTDLSLSRRLELLGGIQETTVLFAPRARRRSHTRRRV